MGHSGKLEMCHVFQIKDIYTDMNQVHLRVYEPIATLEQQNRPVFVYFHGGGFSLLSIGNTMTATIIPVVTYFRNCRCFYSCLSVSNGVQEK